MTIKYWYLDALNINLRVRYKNSSCKVCGEEVGSFHFLGECGKWGEVTDDIANLIRTHNSNPDTLLVNMCVAANCRIAKMMERAVQAKPRVVQEGPVLVDVKILGASIPFTIVTRPTVLESGPSGEVGPEMIVEDPPPVKSFPSEGSKSNRRREISQLDVEVFEACKGKGFWSPEIANLWRHFVEKNKQRSDDPRLSSQGRGRRRGRGRGKTRKKVTEYTDEEGW